MAGRILHPTGSSFILPELIRNLKSRYPHLPLELHIGSPAEIRHRLMASELDLGLCSEWGGSTPELTVLKRWSWPFMLVFPEQHPLAFLDKMSTETLALFPLVTYHEGLDARRRIDAVFESSDIEVDITLSAGSEDVILTSFPAKADSPHPLGVALIRSKTTKT